jgi:hypothetical protein
MPKRGGDFSSAPVFGEVVFFHTELRRDVAWRIAMSGLEQRAARAATSA